MPCNGSKQLVFKVTPQLFNWAFWNIPYDRRVLKYHYSLQNLFAIEVFVHLAKG